jgi:hypothetical protein
MFLSPVNLLGTFSQFTGDSMNNDYVSFLTVAQFRAFRKAVSVLMRAGLQRTQAIEILVHARIESEKFDHRRAS